MLRAKIILILLCLSWCYSSIAQKVILRDRYEDGKILREHIQIGQTDTVLETIYYPNGQINYERQLVHGQRNGWSKIYHESGDLIFDERYKHGQAHGRTKVFYPNGNLRSLRYYQNGTQVDTSYNYNEDQSIRTIGIWDKACLQTSALCTLTVVIHEQGQPVYSYQYIDGWEQDEHTIYHEQLYRQLMEAEAQVPVVQKGEQVFIANCIHCHAKDEVLIGPALGCVTQRKSEAEIMATITQSKVHPVAKLKEQEYQALVEFLKHYCDEEPPK